MTDAPESPSDRNDDGVDDLVTELGHRLSAFGLPHVAGRILAVLLTTSASSTSARDLARQVHASRASISTMSRLLMQTGLVERVTVPGTRGLHYRLAPDAWSRALESDRARMEPTRRFLDDLLENPSALSPKATASLRDLHAYLTFWQEQMDGLRAAWQARRVQLRKERA